ncbi:MAG: P27 family phage terminase small subunit [Mesorhizobium sp.]|nr:MAG: P27 family phage terminase small subunit [Mesorhizobium sp.]RWH79053.1 MAG: P27 family phage terminase small subunit [Mesorhizobium sp.]RWH88240.1 MAG: P27 family phage terminase small subunit [Mesorhizobium sp.]RWH94787.1 MAG: P27 family phage terminase small subunit [Mesorhizobium sp.]RWH98710.1 MAG: P27 family phage terminase small subunit [Mesorhizobium sp.]
MMILRPPRLRRVSGRWTVSVYCQAYGRWVESEKKLKDTPALLRTPAGYVQPSPWLAISNKNVELMHKFMSELGLSPVLRSRVATTHSMGPRPWEFTGQEDDELFS